MAGGRACTRKAGRPGGANGGRRWDPPPRAVCVVTASALCASDYAMAFLVLPWIMYRNKIFCESQRLAVCHRRPDRRAWTTCCNADSWRAWCGTSVCRDFSTMVKPSERFVALAGEARSNPQGEKSGHRSKLLPARSETPHLATAADAERHGISYFCFSVITVTRMGLGSASRTSGSAT